MRESVIETHLRRLVKARGGLCYKFTSAEAGVPDRIVVFRGKTYFVELKRPDGELSAIQRWQHDRLSDAGVEVWVLWDLDAVEGFVEGLE